MVDVSVGVDLAPGRIEVATSPRTGPSGAFLAGVKVRESLTLDATTVSATPAVHWQTRAVLPRGTYYVQVSGVMTGGVTSCFPLRSRCLERWSNVRKIVVP